MSALCLGLDCSTQSLTAMVADAEEGRLVGTWRLNFDRDFPAYGTRSGCAANPENPLEVWSYPLLWLDALDALMGRLSAEIDLSAVRAVSGCGQQHASVWLRSRDAFSSLLPARSLAQNVAPFLSSERAPVWLDASTAAECAEIAAAAGGDDAVLALSGSVATERFTAAQIRRVFKRDPARYAATGRIHLNSSFLCSVLCGADAPADFADASGMNLLNLRTQVWAPCLLEATAPALADKLPALCPSQTLVGRIAPYFVQKYKFAPDTAVVAFTGDNPSSLVGVGAARGERAAVSLGTSDVFFAAAKRAHPVAGAHVFANPLGGYLHLICVRNGSLARERLKAERGVSWDFFDREAFRDYVPENDGNFILPFYVDEIAPKLKSSGPVFIGEDAAHISPAAHVVRFLEGQIFNLRLQAQAMDADRAPLLVLTGGASKSEGVRRLLADIFDVPVGLLSGGDHSAALGGVLRAANAGLGCDWDGLARAFCAPAEIIAPDAKNATVYAAKLEGFAVARKKRFGV